MPSTLLPAFGSCMVDQQVAHRPRSNSKEVGPSPPTLMITIDQANIGLVDQSGCLEGVPWPFAAQITCRKTPELGINQRKKLLRRSLLEMFGLDGSGDDRGSPLTVSRHQPESCRGIRSVISVSFRKLPEIMPAPPQCGFLRRLSLIG